MKHSSLPLFFGVLFCGAVLAPASTVPRLGIHEVELGATGSYTNPYTDCSADATLTEPDGNRTLTLPLFWDGGTSWKFRFSPHKTGTWSWTVKSSDKGMHGQSGTFSAAESMLKGSIRPMRGFPLHFERQDGSPFWFMGDTAWALFTDSAEEKHDRDTAKRYITARAAQGFNVLHSMLLAESNWGNRGGPAFNDLSAEKINPAYWQEIDVRLGHANSQDIVSGLVLAWGDKRKVEQFAWRRFPSLEARKRYARYIAARYSAFNVYFIVSGEWHAEVRTRESTESEVKREFIEIGNALRAADPHGRMTAIHPMTSHGSVREFNEAAWMSFGDYQQNYRDLHERILMSRAENKPVVNSEYGYHLRDQSGDGIPDKDNSTSLEAMRHATWDIVMAGGYVVTGFGTTYFGGNRDPGPFDLDAAKNKSWEAEIGHIKKLFTGLDWWKLAPHDELVRCGTPRGEERQELGRTAPPAATYWCLAEPGKQYVFYVRGLKRPVELSWDGPMSSLPARQFNPRTGKFVELSINAKQGRFEYRPPDDQDWVVLLAANR